MSLFNFPSNVHIDVHIHQVSMADIKTILETVLLIKTNQTSTMATLADIQAQNTALIAAVAAEDTAIDSAVVLINGFATTLSDIQAQLAAAIAANDPAALQAVADSLGATAADVTAKTAALSAAVVANTPTPPTV